jgi:NAD(P)H dehydrogenase (quinone)
MEHWAASTLSPGVLKNFIFKELKFFRTPRVFTPLSFYDTVSFMGEGMNKILVLYDSRGGNTKKMAELVFGGASSLPDTDVRLRNLEEAAVADLFWCDGIAVGSPTHLGLVSAAMKSWWDKAVPDAWGKIDGKIGCAFASAGGRGGGAELVCQSIATILLNLGMLVFGIPDYTGPGQTLHYGAIACGLPQEGPEAEACQRLGRRLAEWSAFYCHGRKEAHPLIQEYRKNK